jgi:hypothetical protein
MLKISCIMNSSVEDILAFKTCCGLKMFDQNLEIHLTNQGPAPVRVPSYFDLEIAEGKKRIDNLMPPGEHLLQPGDLMAFYCTMDESLWNKARGLIFYDTEGNQYQVSISDQNLVSDTSGRWAGA